MLQKIHDVAKGWLAYIIVALLVIPFAFWGIHQYFGSGGERVAAEVNGTKITAREVQNTVQEQKQRLRDVFGGRLPANFADDEVLRDAALDQLIREVLLRQEIDRLRFRVSDEQVLAELKQVEAFQENGTFSPQLYERLLTSQRMSQAGFESRVREALRQEQLEAGVRDSALAPPAFDREYQRLEGQTRELAYAVLSPSSFTDQVDISDEDIKQYYEAHTDAFMTPEQVKLAYIELDEQAIADSVTVTEDELRTFYEEQAGRFTTDEKRQASHILIKVSADAEQAVVDAARQRAEEVLAKLQAGEDFAALAAEYSDDSLTADNGGDLGVLARGDIGPLFDQALFSLEPGEVSEPVRTEFGFEIIKLTDIDSGASQSFDDVRDQIEKEYRQRQAESAFFDRSEQLVTLAYENPGTLQPAADAVGLQVATSDWITRDGGPGPGQHPAVREAAFGEDVLALGRNSDLIEVAPGRVFVIRLLEHRPRAAQPLDAVEEAVRSALVEARSRDAAREAGRAIVARLDEGERLESALEDSRAELQSPGYVGRRDAKVPPEVLREAFKLGPLGERDALHAGVSLSDGGFAVVQVTGVKDGEPKSQAGPARLEAAYGSRELEAFYRVLESRAEIQRFPENL